MSNPINDYQAVEARLRAQEEALGQKPTPLSHLAIQFNDIDALQSILREKPSAIYASTQNAPSPLHLAAKLGRLEMVKLLIESKGDTFSSFISPLYLASEGGQIEVIDYLLEKKAGVDEGFVPPLHAAACFNHAVAARHLLEANANINGNGTNVPLYTAVANGSIDVINVLLDANAQQDLDRDESILQVAVRCDQGKTISLLLERQISTVEEMDECDQTALHFAAYHGSVIAARVLVEAGADLEKRNQRGNTPLMVATLYKKPELVRLLLQLGARIPEEVAERVKDLLEKHGYNEHLALSIIAMRLSHLRLFLRDPNS